MKKERNLTEGPEFRSLFESAPDRYLVLEPDLTIVAASDAYLKATLTKREQIIGRKIFEVFPDNPNDPSATGVGNLQASLIRVLQTKAPDAMAVQKYDIQVPNSEGGGFEERFWSPLNSPVMGADNQVVYIIHRVEDVTEFMRLKQKGNEQNKLTEELKTRTEQMESEIYLRAQELQNANKKLRDAERVKSDFFANVSHELRTPLSLILAPLESVLSGKYGEVPEAQLTFLHTIHNNAIRLLQMVNGLLDFSKFEAGKMNVEREALNISTLTRSVITDFEPMMKAKKIKIEYKNDSPGTIAMMDHYLFERILFNLLSNAIKFTPQDGKVTVWIAVENGKLYLSVEDTGIGIAEKDILNLFQKFKQVEGSSVRRFEGTGLGLAMVKEFSGLLGGTVSVESVVGKGSKFMVECLSPPAQAPVTSGEAKFKPQRVALIPQYQTDSYFEKNAFAHEDGKRKNKLMKVLICEDNDELSFYIVSLLQHICETKTASDGEEGLALVKSWAPDLVLTDVMMPKKNGIEVCRAIKSDPETSKIVVVLLTALTHRDAMIQGWEVKADEYLFKPFHPDELVTRIRSLLDVISERKEAAELIDQKSKELAYSIAELEAFSYSVSHDLRAPLRSIHGYVTVLQEDYESKFDEAGKKAMNIVLSNTEKMNQLIDDLLAFSKLGRREVTKVDLDMNSVVKSVIEEFTAQYEQPDVSIKLHSLEPVMGDLSMIKQVWVNLLSNAFKYSQKQEISIVEIGSNRDENAITYYVKDNGVGFDMDYAHKLFKVFQRLHKATDFIGTGIGLALVKRIIDKHDGQVWAEGKVNEGATFYFSLPITLLVPPKVKKE